MVASPYDVYEIEDGACLQVVKSICHQLTDQGNFGGQAIIKEEGVIRLISATYYEIAAALARHFYSSVQTEKNVLGVLQWFNALGAACKLELAVSTAGFGAQENNRHAGLCRQYTTGLSALLATNSLSVLGAGTIDDPRGDGLSAGGISLSDKDFIRLDTDNKYSFMRLLFDNPDRGQISNTQNES
jgi:hypothetical protein